MSINSGYSIGRTGLLASQVGLQVAGNNISNASSLGFTRQRLDLSPLADMASGSLRLGTGVNTLGIRRLTDRALQQRAWNAASNQASADTTWAQFNNLETLLGSMNDTDLNTPELDGPNISTEFNDYFSAWSTLASHVGDTAAASNVVTAGRNLSARLRDTRAQIISQQNSIDTDLNVSIARANSLLGQIADVNRQIITAGGSAASGLLDRRDQLVSELATLANITVNEQPSGSADILLGNKPLVVGTGTSPMSLRTRADASGEIITEVVAGVENETLGINTGRIGALLNARRTGYQAIVNKIDRLAAQVIYQTNRAYSVGTAATPRTSYTGQRQITSPNLSFNDPANTSFTNLGGTPTSGQVVVEVVTGAGPTLSRQRTTIDIDLNGINASNAPGYADDTSPATFAAALNAIPNLSASIDVNGRLQVTAAGGSSVSFVEDTSGVLAAMGVNSYFTGTNAVDIDINASLAAEPTSLNTTTVSGTVPNQNGMAMAMTALRDQSFAGLGGTTFNGYWLSASQSVSADASNARTQSEATGAVKDALDNQMTALTGVNIDEEAINLVQYQTMYQASARYIGVLQDVTQTLLQLV